MRTSGRIMPSISPTPAVAVAAVASVAAASAAPVAASVRPISI